MMRKLFFSVLMLSILTTSIQVATYDNSDGYLEEWKDSPLQIIPEIHQEYMSNKVREVTNVYEGSNSINVEIPNASNTFLKYANITLGDIFIDNVEIVLEEGNFTEASSSGLGNTHFTSFNVKEDCFISRASFYLFVLFGTPEANVYLFPSVWDAQEGLHYPDINKNDYLGKVVNIQEGWNNIDFERVLLNNSDTTNNTWFIGLRESTDLATLNWGYISDVTAPDNSTCFVLVGGLHELGVDYGSKLYFSPINFHPTPEEIGLTINGESVNSIINSTESLWQSSKEIDLNEKDFVSFVVDSQSHNFYCNITRIKLIFSTHCEPLQFNRSLTVNRDSVEWSSNRGDVSGFDSNFSDPAIHFNLPRSFRNISLVLKKENSTQQLNFSIISEEKYNTIIPFKADEGLYSINAFSNNILESVTFHKNDKSISNIPLSGSLNISVRGGSFLNSTSVSVRVFETPNSTALGVINFSSSPSGNIVKKEIMTDNYISESGTYIFQALFINSTDLGFIETEEKVGMLQFDLLGVVGVFSVVGISSVGVIVVYKYRDNIFPHKDKDPQPFGPNSDSDLGAALNDLEGEDMEDM